MLSGSCRPVLNEAQYVQAAFAGCRQGGGGWLGWGVPAAGAGYLQAQRHPTTLRRQTDCGGRQKDPTLQLLPAEM